MKTIAEAAAAALAAQRQADEQFAQQYRGAIVVDCRQVLAAMVGSAVDVAALTVEHVDLDAELAVLSDQTAPLAVYTDGRVFLTNEVDGRWQRGVEVESLAELGAALAGDA